MSRKNRIIGRIACLIITAVVGSGSLSIEAQTQSSSADLDSYARWVNGISEPWWFSESLAQEDIAAVQRQWTAIGNENRVSGNNLWTGDYFIGGDTHGSYLRWSRQNGFVLFHVDKCAARVMGFSYGKVISSPTLIEFLQERAASESPKHGHSTFRFLPVTWRNDKYLVPDNAIEDFADYVAGLGEYNDPNFTLIEFQPFFSRPDRESAEVGDVGRKKRSGFVEPIVPPGYERFIKRPVDAEITAKGKSYIRHNAENEWWDDLVVPVTINAGSARGLKTNMSLRVVGREGFVIKTTKVRLHSASGVIEQPVRKRPCVKFAPTDDCKDLEYQPVKRGSRVTTNPLIEDSESAG